MVGFRISCAARAVIFRALGHSHMKFRSRRRCTFPGLPRLHPKVRLNTMHRFYRRTLIRRALKLPPVVMPVYVQKRHNLKHLLSQFDRMTEKLKSANVGCSLYAADPVRHGSSSHDEMASTRKIRSISRDGNIDSFAARSSTVIEISSDEEGLDCRLSKPKPRVCGMRCHSSQS